jgi:hypothetical protein
LAAYRGTVCAVAEKELDDVSDRIARVQIDNDNYSLSLCEASLCLSNARANSKADDTMHRFAPAHLSDADHVLWSELSAIAEAHGRAVGEIWEIRRQRQQVTPAEQGSGDETGNSAIQHAVMALVNLRERQLQQVGALTAEEDALCARGQLHAEEAAFEWDVSEQRQHAQAAASAQDGGTIAQVGDTLREAFYCLCGQQRRLERVIGERDEVQQRLFAVLCHLEGAEYAEAVIESAGQHSTA